jgi:hypothetical protein
LGVVAYNTKSEITNLANVFFGLGVLPRKEDIMKVLLIRRIRKTVLVVRRQKSEDN